MSPIQQPLIENSGTNGPASVVMPSNPRSIDETPFVPAVDLTTEIRWFLDGALPAEVARWFTPGGIGLFERRCDAYVDDGRFDMGVKKRGRQTLELKVRSSGSDPATLAENVHGYVETWQRWSPADELLSQDEKSTWVDIDKTIVKRRFDSEGQERPLSESNRVMTEGGCDVELAAISANGREAWTFAFAAFGHSETTLDAVRLAWLSLIEVQAPPAELRLHIGSSIGYPEWVETVANPGP